jgi:hypothetical protein
VSTKTRNSIFFEITPAFRFPDVRLSTFSVEELLSQTLKACHLLKGQAIDIDEQHLSYRRPAHAHRYKEFMEAPIFLVLKKCYHCTGIDIAAADGERHCREMLVKLQKADTFIDNIRRLVFASINNPPHAKEIAHTLKISLCTFGILSRNTWESARLHVESRRSRHRRKVRYHLSTRYGRV